jgi:hypothetical protein
MKESSKNKISACRSVRYAGLYKSQFCVFSDTKTARKKYPGLYRNHPFQI